uniref:CSON001124 protein n=1 Tax=Culicoides sonorensis TaxID=179676 RepID=A0A336MK00_CULSO
MVNKRLSSHERNALSEKLHSFIRKIEEAFSHVKVSLNITERLELARKLLAETHMEIQEAGEKHHPVEEISEAALLEDFSPYETI